MSDPRTTRTVTVTGLGHATATPDNFQINIGIEALRETVREAYSAAGAALNAVQAKLLENNVPQESMTSTGLDVRSETRWQEGAGSVVTGYTVSSTLNVVLKYDGGGEDVIAAVVDAGDNAVRLNRLVPVVTNPEAAQDEAKERAFASAYRAAKLYAAAAGATLGEVLAITEGVQPSSSPAPIMARALKTSDSAMKIEPGQSTISESVSVTFALN